MTDRIGPIEGVYEEHAARLWRALLGYAGDPHVASDAMVEAFAQALAHESEIRSPADWVWTASFRIAPMKDIATFSGPTTRKAVSRR